MGTAIATALAGEVASRAVSAVRTLTQKEKSLLDFARIGQITPMVAIDSDIRHNPLVKDILHLLSTLYVGFYMQALAYEDLIGDVKITERLEKFNPNSGPSILRGVGIESLGEYGLGPVTKSSLEAYNTAKKGTAPDVVTKENIAEMYEDRSLAVGKTLTLKLHDSLGNARPIPVTIRLDPLVADSSTLIAAYSLGSRWNTQEERKHRIAQGELRRVLDGWFKLDMIEEHRRALMNDKNGVYSAISDRRSGRLLDNIIKGNSSFVSAAAMTIISAKTAKELERRMGGRLDNVRTREFLFQESGLMILVLFDATHDQLVFYYRGSNEPARMSANEVKSGGKKKDVDVMELINTFMNKGTPSF